MDVVTRAKMVKKIAKEAGITQKAANTTINLFFDTLTNAIGEHKAFIIPGIGKIYGYLRPEKMGRDPRNGNMILFKEKTLARFKSSFKRKKKK